MRKWLALFLIAALLLPVGALAETIADVTDFEEGFAIVTNADGKKGAINTAGNLVVPCIYDEIKDFNCDVDFRAVALVERDGKTGYVDDRGIEFVPCEYDGGFPMEAGIGIVWADGLYSVVNAGGELLPLEDLAVEDCHDGWMVARFIDTIYGYIITNFATGEECLLSSEYAPREARFVDGYMIVYEADLLKSDNKSGIIDTAGNFVVPCEYDVLYGLQNGLCKAQKDGKYGYISVTGETVVPHKYEMVSDFCEGMAYVVDFTGKCGFVDMTGQEVVPCIYQSAYNFSEGLAMVQDDDGLYGFINLQGEKVISSLDYSNVSIFSDGLCAVMTHDGAIGFIDAAGELVIEPRYASCGEFINGYCRVQRDGGWGVIDREGNEVYPCEYQQVRVSEEYLTLLKDGEITIIPVQ